MTFRQHAHRLAPLVGAVTLALAVSGCSTKMERADVVVHSAPTNDGAGWTYRDKPHEAEAILVGNRGEYDVSADAALLSTIWAPLKAQVSVESDIASSFVLIKLDDAGTKRLNPVKGGPFSWSLGALQEAVTASLGVIGEGQSPRYSVHLVALADDIRPLWSDELVAQVRLRRLSSMIVESGVDSRLVSGQVWEKRIEPTWKLALVLRPFRYGNERTSTALMAAGAF